MTPVVACAPCVCGSLVSSIVRHGLWVATVCAGCLASSTCMSVADYLHSGDHRRPDQTSRRRDRPPVAAVARKPRRSRRARGRKAGART